MTVASSYFLHYPNTSKELSRTSVKSEMSQKEGQNKKENLYKYLWKE